eukprot:gene776-4064_t
MLEEDIFNGVDDDASNSGRVGVSEIIGGGANVGYGRGGEDLFLENDINDNPFSFKKFVQTKSGTSEVQGKNDFDIERPSEWGNGSHDSEEESPEHKDKSRTQKEERNPFSFKRFIKESAKPKELPHKSDPIPPQPTAQPTQTNSCHVNQHSNSSSSFVSSDEDEPPVNCAPPPIHSTFPLKSSFIATDTEISDDDADNDLQQSPKLINKLQDPGHLNFNQPNKSIATFPTRPQSNSLILFDELIPKPNHVQSIFPEISNSTPSRHGTSGSFAVKIKQKIEMLTQELEKQQHQTESLVQQHQLEVSTLRQDNDSLRADVSSTREKLRKAEKRAKRAAALLKEKEERDHHDTLQLENMVKQVETNLEIATKRAVTAEHTVEELRGIIRQLKEENEHLKSSLSTPAVEQVHLAASYLRKACTDADQNIRFVTVDSMLEDYWYFDLDHVFELFDQYLRFNECLRRNLVSGVKTLQTAAMILESVGRIEPL